MSDTVEFKFSLGDTVRDKITPFEGTIDCRTQWLNGCIRYSVQPAKLTEDGGPVKSIYIDEDQLVLIETKAINKELPQTGGPRDDSRTFSR